jgi:DNA-binding MarR family transcriptional regulator
VIDDRPLGHVSEYRPELHRSKICGRLEQVGPHGDVGKGKMRAELLPLAAANILMIEETIFMIKIHESPEPVSPILVLLDDVRALYGAMDRFDAQTASALAVDRTAVRAINLMERGPVSPSQVGTALGLTSGAVTALLQRLQQAGHIGRVDTADGRRRDAQLTAAGRRAAHREFERLGQTIAAHFANQSPRQIAQAADALRRLAAAFDAAATTVARTKPRRPTEP